MSLNVIVTNDDTIYIIHINIISLQLIEIHILPYLVIKIDVFHLGYIMQSFIILITFILSHQLLEYAEVFQITLHTDMMLFVILYLCKSKGNKNVAESVYTYVLAFTNMHALFY